MIKVNSESKPINLEQPSTRNQNEKIYDLEERTFIYAKRINDYVNKLPHTLSNFENGKQLIKAGCSVGANYIEANEALSKKDLKWRIKVSKKESKEARYWLGLTEPIEKHNTEKEALIQESTELMNIFGAIIKNLKYKY
jgi:four helix bundle protein